MSRHHRLALTALAAVPLLLMLSGCFNPFDPLVSTERAVSSPAPTPSTPANVVKLFEWCWQNRAITEYSEIFTSDYRFQFATGDSAGNLYRDRPITREDELISATNLFVGGADRPPASKITLSFDKTLIALGDPRPNTTDSTNKTIRTTVDLQVVIDHGDGSEETNQVQGFALFFLVRGDVPGIIPDELKAKGFKPDRNRWWIQRWEDETLPAGGGGGGIAQALAHPAVMQPAGPMSWTLPIVTWGDLKARFLP